ncbi:hypothetical protein CCAX7_60120 [Capsulimonas corticalis]|uniref:Uncharacterized protein n=1 Tax=Capsulimonas corticalis TaxID=2219043 RepID=A0A402D795_9BACT|nr:hypothetical protein CCAX7_60120 [Capsulimonas corticalis]
MELGLSEDQLRTIAIAALLHDVGKIGVPDAVLRKPGRLMEEEFAAIKQHPMMGASHGVVTNLGKGNSSSISRVQSHKPNYTDAANRGSRFPPHGATPFNSGSGT